MSIRENLNSLKNQIPEHVTLVAVSKTKPIEDILMAYSTGHRIFGENKVQEMVDKFEKLPNDIKWHMIGHLQKNKVKLIAPFIHTIQSVDTIDLLKKINQYAEKNNRKINCLIQIKIAQEVSKFGFNIDAAKKLLNSNYVFEYPHLNINGIMAMATFTSNKNQIKREFDSLLNIKKIIKHQNPILSIGMSHDYQLAYKSGSNMIRIGSAIFQ